MAKMIKQADKEVKTAIINTIHMFKKVEKNMKITRKCMEDIKKGPNGKCRDLKYILTDMKI